MESAATAAALQPQPAVDGSNGLLAGLTTLAVDTAGPSQGGDGPSGTETGGVSPPGIKAHQLPGTRQATPAAAAHTAESLRTRRQSSSTAKRSGRSGKARRCVEYVENPEENM